MFKYTIALTTWDWPIHVLVWSEITEYCMDIYQGQRATERHSFSGNLATKWHCRSARAHLHCKGLYAKPTTYFDSPEVCSAKKCTANRSRCRLLPSKPLQSQSMLSAWCAGLCIVNELLCLQMACEHTPIYLHRGALYLMCSVVMNKLPVKWLVSMCIQILFWSWEWQL